MSKTSAPVAVERELTLGDLNPPRDGAIAGVRDQFVRTDYPDLLRPQTPSAELVQSFHLGAVRDLARSSIEAAGSPLSMRRDLKSVLAFAA